MKTLTLFGLVIMTSACTTSSSGSTSVTVEQTACGAEVSAVEKVRTAALLLDVRTAGEFAEGHLKGARNIPVDELEQRVDELSILKERPIAVYCRSGKRSARAKEILDSKGFSQVSNVGGYEQLKGCSNYSVPKN